MACGETAQPRTMAAVTAAMDKAAGATAAETVLFMASISSAGWDVL